MSVALSGAEPPRRRHADVPPGDESRPSRHPECAPLPERAGLRLGRRTWTWREIDARVAALAAALCRARRRQGRPHARALQELRRDVLVDVRGLPARCGLGADQFPPAAGRGRVSRHVVRREGLPVPRRFPGSCGGGRGGSSRRALHLVLRGRAPSARPSVGDADRRTCRREACRTPRSSTTIPAGSSSPRAPRGAPRRPCSPTARWLRHHQPSRRPDAGHDEEDASLVVAPLSHGAGVHQLTQVARGAADDAAADRDASTSRRPGG